MPPKTYAQKLLDPRWQKKRLEILERDEFTCQNCSSTEKTLQVHHWKYGKEPWAVDDCYLITLCDECHKSAQESWNEIIEAIAQFARHDGAIGACEKLNVIYKWISACDQCSDTGGIDHQLAEDIVNEILHNVRLSGYRSGIEHGRKNPLV